MDAETFFIILCICLFHVGTSIAKFKNKTMKKLTVFTAALGVGFLLYAVYKKLRLAEDKNDTTDVRTESGSRHITDVFTRAKHMATAEDIPTGEPAVQ